MAKTDGKTAGHSHGGFAHNVVGKPSPRAPGAALPPAPAAAGGRQVKVRATRRGYYQHRIYDPPDEGGS